MIRILFIILAVVAAIMAMLLQRPELYYLAGGLLVVALVLIATSLARRRKRHRKARSTAPYTPPEPAESDDLSSLGILEIRPKNKGGTPPPPETAEAEDAPQPQEVLVEDEAEASTPDEAPPAGTAARGPAYQTPPAVKERPPSVQAVDVGGDVEAPRFREVVGPYLQALRAALDAQTVCLLKQREIALKYHIEAIVSQNAYARSSGHFSTRTPLLNASEARKPVTVRRVGDGGLAAANLGYYRESLAVRQVALAPVPHPVASEMFFLLADTMQEGVLGSGRKRMLLAEFARLLGTLMEKPAHDEPAEDVEAMRPRRDIIAEEMEKARAKRRPLALGLVYLNQAEGRADEGDEAVATAERTLEDALRGRTRKGRVERFGELTYGVFLNEPVTDVESWALKLQRDLAEAKGPLEGGISIGFAMLQERHTEVDTFRADATAALHEAYESGTCVILE